MPHSDARHRYGTVNIYKCCVELNLCCIEIPVGLDDYWKEEKKTVAVVILK